LVLLHPELFLLRGLSVALLKHPSPYSKILICEGFFNRLLNRGGHDGGKEEKK
jgi:hypothetical protein